MQEMKAKKEMLLIEKGKEMQQKALNLKKK